MILPTFNQSQPSSGLWLVLVATAVVYGAGSEPMPILAPVLCFHSQIIGYQPGDSVPEWNQRFACLEQRTSGAGGEVIVAKDQLKPIIATIFKSLCSV